MTFPPHQKTFVGFFGREVVGRVVDGEFFGREVDGREVGFEVGVDVGLQVGSIYSGCGLLCSFDSTIPYKSREGCDLSMVFSTSLIVG